MDDRQFRLTLQGNLPVGKFEGEGFLVRRFKETMPQRAMNFHSSADDGVGL